MSKLFTLYKEKKNAREKKIVADGVMFPSGKVVVCWRGKFEHVIIYNNVIEMKSISCVRSKIKVSWKD